MHQDPPITIAVPLHHDDKIWKVETCYDDLEELLKRPHGYVSDRVRIERSKYSKIKAPYRARLAPHYLISFDGLIPWEKDDATAVVIDGIHRTSLVTVRRAARLDKAVREASNNEKIDLLGDDEEFVEMLLKSLSATLPLFATNKESEIDLSELRTAQDQALSGLPKREKGLIKLVKIAELDKLSYAHVELGRNWPYVGWYMFTCACNPQKLMNALNNAPQQLWNPVKDKWCDLAEHEKRCFEVPDGQPIRFLFQGRRRYSARALAPVACNINQGVITDSSTNTTQVGTVIVKSYATP